LADFWFSDAKKLSPEQKPPLTIQDIYQLPIMHNQLTVTFAK
jgi:hypothetical protein